MEASGAGVRGKRILLVEDDEFVRSLVETQLAMLGYDVTCADDAASAIAILAAGERVHLLMTDVSMPGALDGLRLAAHVRERWPAIAILVASGNGADRTDAHAVGAPHLQKPYVLAELERKLLEAAQRTPLPAEPQPADARCRLRR